MGSVCCTSARGGDMAEASEGWSIEPTGHTNYRARHGALSPPSLSSRWERKAHFPEFAAGHNCTSLYRTSSSSSRICRSISSENRANSVQCHPERGDGLLAFVNSPSESFRYSQRSFDHGAYSVALPSESGLRRSAAYSSQEESGASTTPVSFSSSSQKALEESDCVLKIKPVHSLSKHGLSTSNTCLHSKQVLDPSLSFEGSSRYDMLRNRMDMPSAYYKQKSGSWKIRGFSELVDSYSQPGSSRWSSMGISSSMFADAGDYEVFNELYIRSTGSMHHHDSCSAPQIETQNCGLCKKAISQKSLWNFSRVLGNKDMPVVGILDCGHVYHAECLDQATPLTQAHDPPCPKCKDQAAKAQSKAQGGSCDMAKGTGLIERPTVKCKLSRVGVSTEEDFIDLEPSRSYQLDHCGLSESSSKKGASISLDNGAERSFSTKSLLRKQFSLRGKLSREATSSSLGSKRPGYPARVSPENSIREDDSASNWRQVH